MRKATNDSTRRAPCFNALAAFTTLVHNNAGIGNDRFSGGTFTFNTSFVDGGDSYEGSYEGTLESDQVTISGEYYCFVVGTTFEDNGYWTASRLGASIPTPAPQPTHPRAHQFSIDDLAEGGNPDFRSLRVGYDDDTTFDVTISLYSGAEVSGAGNFVLSVWCPSSRDHFLYQLV